MATPKCETSEKWLERRLVTRVRLTGGRALKYQNPIETGFPDRLLLYPGGVALWVELKSRGKKPTEMQQHRMQQLRNLGFCVWVADCKETIEQIVQTAQELSEKARQTKEWITGSGRTTTSAGR